MHAARSVIAVGPCGRLADHGSPREEYQHSTHAWACWCRQALLGSSTQQAAV